MVGKNNFKEKLRQMVTQNKREHFAIRKLTVGAVSVLLGVTFLGVNNQTAKADTVTSTPATQTKKQPDLTTYQALKSFLKSDDQAAQANAKPAPTTNTNKSQANDVTSQPAPTASTKPAATTNTTTNITSNDPATTKPTATTNTSTDITNDDNTTTKPAVTTQDQVKPQDGTLDYNGVSRATTDGKAFDKTTDSTVYVGNWNDLFNSYTNSNISKIEIINNIQFTGTPGMSSGVNISIPGRNLIVESGGDNIPAGGYIIDFKMYSPIDLDTGNKALMDITYHNLQLYCQSFLGIMNTVDQTDGYSKVTLDNVKFTGSQVLYSGQFTYVYIKNNFNANVVKSYKNPLDSTDTADWLTQGSDGQQAFELSESGEKITFTKGCHAELSTSDGNVIQMFNHASSEDDMSTVVDPNNPKKFLPLMSQVIIQSGADVTLNPRRNPAQWDENPQTTFKSSGIYFRQGTVGRVQVDKNAKLTINVGSDFDGAPDAFTGTLDRHKTSAIVLNGANAKIIDDGTINVNTNGDISNVSVLNVPGNILIYDGGDLQVNPGAALNIIGRNMQKFTGKLLYIGGKADLDGGSLDIELQDDPNYPNDPAHGAGEKSINLVDVASNTALKVNNPKKLVLNASLNKAPGTSIIGDNEIDITNVRQKFDFSSLFPDLPTITLPPFHLLKVQKNKGNGHIEVLANGIEVLNGKLPLSETAVNNISDAITAYPEIGQVLMQAFNADSLADLSQKLDILINGISYDDLFVQIIDQAFSDTNNIGYNNISMIPTNSGGFLNIEDDNGILGEASYHQDMKDGSVTISGKIVNYDPNLDGPKQSNNMFSQIMPVGTDAYIIAKIGNGKDVYVDPKNVIPDPYKETNDGQDSTNVTNDLPHTFTAKANADGTFSFKIPAGTVVTGDTISLTPEANFIGLDPEDKDHTSVIVQIGNIADLSQIKISADNSIDQGLEIAKQRIIASGLSEPDQQEFLDAVQDAHDNDEYYIDNATTFTTVNTYLTYAYDTYNQEGAKSEFKYYVQQCEQKLNITDADKDMQTVINNTMTLCNGAIATSIHSDHVESKTENCLTNQNRDWAEGYALDRFKCWVNDQMSALVTKQMNTCKNNPSLNLTADQIASLKDRSHTVLIFAQSDVTSASDIDVVVEKYQAGVKQINDFFTTNLNSISRDQAIQGLRDELAKVTAKISNGEGEYASLTTLQRNQLISVVNNAAMTGILAVMNCSDADVTNNYNAGLAGIDNAAKLTI
ncbi:YSIRK-type signal peptide-containing protein [Lactobacillus sp. ESL0677]|uniref:YSIRK-type signal peptide-containing protein n=1 Tax=Lactobacillus sp. ESL0677 TaxID=2983208 RepID=UPI0023F7BBE3|nr:YSIRK-type signal peptide-containing protein [Lactobacillus sp. ESL0677]WEV37604.1 YSIRK-type signal peptide-containing protein [Lactobacillus sp. ESL0677]